MAAPLLVAAAAAAQDAATLELGKRLFSAAEPPCAICHTLADAGAVGEIGPNLDDLKPPENRARLAVKDGLGAMPAYGDKLSDAEIAAVAAYVATAAGGAN